MDGEQGDGEVRRDYRVTGRVQGVGFRWWTRETADRLGLRGTVRNRPDGSVEVKAAGAAAAMDAFLDRLRSGPSSARVEAVEEVAVTGGVPRDFRIER